MAIYLRTPETRSQWPGETAPRPQETSSREILGPKTWHKLEIAWPGGRRGTRRAAEVTNAPNAKRCA